MSKKRVSGGSRGAAKKTLRTLSDWRPDENQWQDLFSEIVGQTDRSAAIVAGAFLDATLLLAIQSYMSDDEKLRARLFENPTAPLSTFSSRISIGLGLGFYTDKVSKELDTIRQIRNAFAHTLKPVDFTEPLIEEACNKLPMHSYPASSFPKLPEQWCEAKKRYVGVCFRRGHDLVGVSFKYGNRVIQVPISD